MRLCHFARIEQAPVRRRGRRENQRNSTVSKLYMFRHTRTGLHLSNQISVAFANSITDPELRSVTIVCASQVQNLVIAEPERFLDAGVVGEEDGDVGGEVQEARFGVGGVQGEGVGGDGVEG